jgi:hypothetical protein
MTMVLAQIATVVIVLGMSALVIGFMIAISIAARVALSQPDFWDGQWGSFAKRMEVRSRVGELARQEENTSRSGKVSDWLLRRGTFLLMIGGIAKAILFLIQRQAT